MMDEWVSFAIAIEENDVTKIICIATPGFVARHPRCLAVFCGVRIEFDDDETVVAHLFSNGASRNEDTDLLITSMYSYRPMLTKALLKCGCDVNGQNEFDMTPLDAISTLKYDRRKYDTFKIILIDAGGELNSRKDSEIQSIIDFRKNARIVAITCIGIGRKRREGRDVFAIIARIVWSERIKRFI